MEKAGVQVELGKEVTPELIDAIKPDVLIVATGAESVNTLSEAVKDKVAKVYVIGDARNPATALQATADAAWAGREI